MEALPDDSGAPAGDSGGWEWGSLLDIPIDDESGLLSWGDSSPLENQPSGTDTSFSPSDLGAPYSAPTEDRVRKRDPRLVCPNFMAGRVPCACPEVDEKEEEDAMNVRKRSKTVVRCQVPDCEADITELKGYHRRHRVCLRCAYAPTVVLDGQMHRYCQQCGKFHLLPDFDEGKRSCRRKLERHNHRRRRKSLDCKNAPETSHPIERQKLEKSLADCRVVDDEAGKGKILRESCGDASGHVNEQGMDTNEMFGTEDILASPLRDVALQINNCSLDARNEVIPSSTTSGGIGKELGNGHFRSGMSSSFYDNKTTYSSMCPTGRVSFKLYDWNPAEFPRRLRLQIFQWLSKMPVELEGYIRPGCTILTAFIAMPQIMWKRLSEDDVLVNDLINAPESLLAGRGNMLIYLNHSIFQFLEGKNSLTKITIRIKAPRLHYVYPICFESGKPMEFVACGENLDQPRFRFLVSFGRRYLPCEHCQVVPVVKAADDSGTKGNNDHKYSHEILKVYVPCTDPEIYGPAFMEVENESGLSNFIPVLLGDRQMCSEFEMVQEALCVFSPQWANGSRLGDYVAFRNSCAFSREKQMMVSELLLDIAWLISDQKKGETYIVSSHVLRLNRLLDFLIRNKFVSILKKILRLQKVLMISEELHNLEGKEANNPDLYTFQLCLNSARDIIATGDGCVRDADNLPLELDDSAHENLDLLVPKQGLHTVAYIRQENASNQEEIRIVEEDDTVSTRPGTASSLSEPGDHKTPLLVKDFVVKVHGYTSRGAGQLGRSNRGRARHFSGSYLRTRPLVIMVAAIAFCCGLCMILKHPHEVWELSHAVGKCFLGVHHRGRKHRQDTLWHQG